MALGKSQSASDDPNKADKNPRWRGIDVVVIFSESAAGIRLPESTRQISETFLFMGYYTPTTNWLRSGEA
jgi:hypothetical protein